MSSGTHWFFKRSRRESAPAGDSFSDHQARNDLTAYEALLIREVEKDTLLWQAPALALTAQAFLLTIALNEASELQAVIVSATLGMLIALLSMQLMARHRLLTTLDRAYMHYLEDKLELPHLSNRSYFYLDGKYHVPEHLTNRGAPQKVSWIASRRSYPIWFWGLGLFVAVNPTIVLFAILT